MEQHVERAGAYRHARPAHLLEEAQPAVELAAEGEIAHDLRGPCTTVSIWCFISALGLAGRARGSHEMDGGRVGPEMSMVDAMLEEGLRGKGAAGTRATGAPRNLNQPLVPFKHQRPVLLAHRADRIFDVRHALCEVAATDSTGCAPHVLLGWAQPISGPI